MDSKLQIFKTSNSDQLYKLSSSLFQSGFFNCYLTSQQFNLLDYLLNHFKDKDSRTAVWNAFLNGSIFLKFKDKSLEKNGNDENDNMPSENNDDLYIKTGYASIRSLNSTIRYLLYEKAVDYYYSDSKHRETYAKEFNLLETDDDGEKNDTNAVFNSREKLENNDNQQVRNEDDDYDDDEDDEEDDEDDEKDDNEKNNEEKDDNHKKVESKQNNYEDAMDIDSEGKKIILPLGSNGEIILQIDTELLKQKPEYPAVPELSLTDEAIGKMVHPILGTTSAIESNYEKQNELKLIKNFTKIYHGFENDLPNIYKRRRLERSNKQLEMSESNETGKDNSNDDSDTKQVNKLINLGGAANLSLKNLLGRIENNRDKLNITDIELKNLIMDVRRNRSKWANYNKIGQEELYEACEKVLTELRSYTEHSTPFLNRVSKREAPNYYQIIKIPMDLNTVMKKLKTLQYQNKKQFVDDLMLIWQNCLTYNSDPKHFIRIDALAMQKKALSLTPLIPDITIRDRAEVEKEAAELELAQKEEEQQEQSEKKKGVTSTRGVGNADKKAKKTRKGGQESATVNENDSAIGTPFDESATDIKEEATESPTPLVNNSAITTPLPSTKLIDKSNDDGTTDVTPIPNMDDDHEDEDINMDDGLGHGHGQTITQQIDNQEMNEETEDLEMSTWKNLTSNTRFKLCVERSKLFKNNKIQPDAEAVFRDKNQMFNFNRYLDEDANVVLHKNRKYFDENDDPYLIEYDVGGGVPSFKHKNLDMDKIEDGILDNMMSEGKDLKSLPDSGMKIQKKGTNVIVLDNIALMQDIRKTCFKINLIRQMQTSQFVHQSQFIAPETQRLNLDDIDPISKLETRDIMTPNVAYTSLQKSISSILMLNGFESTNPSCASLLTQIGENYFSNLAKSLKLHMESNSINKLPIKNHSPLTFRDIVYISLKENGIEKPDVLYSYYKEHLPKQNKKLEDLKLGLDNFLRDLLRPGIQDLSENQFNDDSEQFVNGDFSDELGEDFFGFKELGLDKEFGLLTTNIPLHLLQSKLSHQFNQMNKYAAKRVYEDFAEVNFPKLRKKDVSEEIGLMQPFYEDLFIKSKNMYAKQLKKHQTMIESGEKPDVEFKEIKNEALIIMIEDDDLPLKQRNNRPKIPPNGKITQIKKKFVANSFFIEKQDEVESKFKIKLSMERKKKEEKMAKEKKGQKPKSYSDGKSIEPVVSSGNISGKSLPGSASAKSTPIADEDDDDEDENDNDNDNDEEEEENEEDEEEEDDDENEDEDNEEEEEEAGNTPLPEQQSSQIPEDEEEDDDEEDEEDNMF